METLPENWNTMTHAEKDMFFCKYYGHYMRPGEINGIWEEADDTIKKAYDAFLKESEEKNI